MTKPDDATPNWSDPEDAEYWAWHGLVNGSLDGLKQLIRAGHRISPWIADEIAQAIDRNVAGYQLRIVGRPGQKLGWHARCASARRRARIGIFMDQLLKANNSFDAAVDEAVKAFDLGKHGRKTAESCLTVYRKWRAGTDDMDEDDRDEYLEAAQEAAEAARFGNLDTSGG